jgi:Sds3-like
MADDNDASAANGSEDEAESEYSENWEEEDGSTKANNLNGDASRLTTPQLQPHHSETSHGSNLLGSTLQEVADELTHEPEESKAGIMLGVEAPGDVDPVVDEVAPDVEVDGEDEIEAGAEAEAEGEAENEPEPVDLDPSEEHDLNSALRVEALDALSVIEIKFALLRERVYVDKMVALLAEEELVDKGIHPELGHLQRELEKRRERRCGLALRKRKRDEEVNVARKQTAELGLTRWYKVTDQF